MVRVIVQWLSKAKEKMKLSSGFDYLGVLESALKLLCDIAWCVQFRSHDRTPLFARCNIFPSTLVCHCDEYNSYEGSNPVLPSVISLFWVPRKDELVSTRYLDA